MLKFISFSSGSSGNCYYLATCEDGLIIDSGLGIRTLKKYCRDYGVSLASVHNVLVTHDHADHVKSVGNLSIPPEYLYAGSYSAFIGIYDSISLYV